MIVTAVERNGFVYVYGENNRLLFTQSGELYGFTGSSVSVKRGSFVYVYSETGSLINTQAL